MKKIWFSFSFLIMLECNNRNKEIPSLPIRFPNLTVSTKRDSLYIATTVWQYMDKKIDVFNYYKQNNIPFDKIQVNVDTIFYSPDTLRLVALIIKKIPNNENNKPYEYFYDGDDFIGYRSNTKEAWVIYYWGQYRPTGFTNYNKVKNIFRNYYFGKFKEASEYVWDNVKKDRVLERFGYNLNEPEFWTKSLVWRLGARLPNLYNFQTTGNVKPGDPDAVKIIPPLDYPDSLLKLYK